jgi:hypothetical protein
MSQNTPKFARTATIESALQELRLAAEAGDSARVVTAAGALQNLLNLFRGIRHPFKNVGEMQAKLNPNPYGHAFPDPQEAYRAEVLGRVFDRAKSDKRLQTDLKARVEVDDPTNPNYILAKETLYNIVGTGHLGGNRVVTNFLARLLNNNRFQHILDFKLNPNIVRAADKFDKNGNLIEQGKQISVRDVLFGDSAHNLTISDPAAFRQEMQRIGDQIASTYQGTALYHKIRNRITIGIALIVGTKLAANVTMIGAAAATMGSPSASAVQQATDINAGGSDPVMPPGASTPVKGTGHPAMTNGNNFGNLGGVQGGAGTGMANDPNVPFSQRIIDYSSMYRENASQDSRVALAQQQAMQEAPPEVRKYLDQIPDPQTFVEQLAKIIQANGGPEAPKAIEAANAYAAQIEAKVAPLMQSTQ